MPDLPDYEKKIIIVTPAGEYPAVIRVDLREILGEDFITPTLAGCVPISIENDALAYDATNDRFKVDVEAMSFGTISTETDLAKVLGSALAHANPVIARLTDGTAFIDPRDISDRAARLLGAVYGSQGQKLLQRATTYDLLVQLRHAGAEIDPRSIRYLTQADETTVYQDLLGSLNVRVGGNTLGNGGGDNRYIVVDSDGHLQVDNLSPVREDLISLGGVASPSGAGVQIIAPSGTIKIKVYDCGYDALAAGLHYFYFGTTTTPTTKRFCTRQTGTGAILKTFVQPRVSDAGDGLYIYSAVAETNMPYDLGYVPE